MHTSKQWISNVIQGVKTIVTLLHYPIPTSTYNTSKEKVSLFQREVSRDLNPQRGKHEHLPTSTYDQSGWMLTFGPGGPGKPGNPDMPMWPWKNTQYFRVSTHYFYKRLYKWQHKQQRCSSNWTALCVHHAILEWGLYFSCINTKSSMAAKYRLKW